MKEGKRIAFLGNLSHKKGIQLLLEGFYAIYEADKDFSLHIAGSIQDSRYGAYLDHFISDLGLQDNIYYDGKITNVNEWLQNKDFIICSSPWEGCPVGVGEAMSCGLKPLLHSFVGAKDLYPREYIWKTVPELVQMALAGRGNPQEYRDFVEEKFSLKKQLDSIVKLVDELAIAVPKSIEKKEKKVVAIIAVKDGVKTIDRALTSIHAQTKKVDAIIVVDDGSTDGTAEQVRKYKKVTVISNLDPRWVFSARNQGFEYLKENYKDTDYFFFLDADDKLPEDYVEKLSKTLDNNPDVSVAYCDMVYFDEKDKEQKYDVPEFSPQTLMERNYISYSSMQRVKDFDTIGGFSEFLNDTRNHLSEWHLWLKYVQNGRKFKRCGLTHFCYYRAAALGSDTQMSMNYERPRVDQHVEMATQLVTTLDAIKVDKARPKILIVCQGKDYISPKDIGFELMVWTKPLENFGDVYVFQYDVVLKHFGKDGMVDQLEKMLNVINPNIVFHPTYRNTISGKTWNEISKVFTTIAWNSDDDRRYESYSKEYGKNFQYVVTTYPEIYDVMDHPGKILSAWAANTHYFKPKEKTIDVSFCGQNYGDRAEMLDGLNVEVYGGGWPNGFIPFTKMADVLGRSKIGISFSGGADGKTQVKLRPFEICACNTLCLCEKCEGLKTFYEEGREIIFFESKQELKDKIDYYLSNEDERKEIANNAAMRSWNEHTWQHRLGEIFKQIKDK